ncbi:MAG TPA: acylneuraminate cytidylyltransferase family protein [Cerasibacillus sp.]|uniref:acylneuraminate cytidylyltransferase family protein n=1 Tax=Cerasibacillus sp. TaxID=2498711 RepID=UPI002F3F602F
MYNDKTFLAVIPARGGSKGIPRKNIIKINKKPLIQYTIDAALSSKYLDDIIVSTDDKEIATISRDLGASVPYLRPKHLATEQSPTIETLIHVIEGQKKLGRTYDYVVTLQPTQPLRQARHINEAIEKIIYYNADSLTSVSKVMEHPILMRTLMKNDQLKNILNMNSTVRRQDFSEIYKVNGAIYINKTSCMNSETSLNDNKLAYIMENIYDLDIDEPSDINLFKWMIENKGV